MLGVVDIDSIPHDFQISLQCNKVGFTCRLSEPWHGDSGDGTDYDDDDDEFDDDTSMVMSLANPLDCIGCQACSKVCPKNCMTHGRSEIVEAA